MPDPERMVRYARPTDFHNGILGCSAFERSWNDDDGLSVSWRGVLHANDEVDILSLQIVLSSHRKLSKNGRLAEISRSDIAEVGTRVGLALDVDNDIVEGLVFDGPDGKVANSGLRYENRAHALVRNLPLKDSLPGDLQSEFVGELLAGYVDVLYPAIP